MKIIAIVRDMSPRKFLVEVTSGEIAAISRGVFCEESPERSLEVGDKVMVLDVWKRIHEINNAQDRLDYAAASIRAVADLLGTINVVVPADPEKPANTSEGGAK